MIKRIGIMGGTFDPPHMGHLLMAEVVRENKKLDEIWFIPTGKIPHKESSEAASAKDRLKMTCIATEENPFFHVNSIEATSGEFSYTYKTLQRLKEENPDYEFTFIVGADSLDYMDQWREPGEIFKLCSVVAVNRTGFSDEEMDKKKRSLILQFGGRIDIVKMPIIGISSTEIRHRRKMGLSVKYLVTDKVLEYIESEKIYL